ncbi:pyruvate dehydrogenase E2 component (dihydrolipoamide acetyltransferase) [Lentibacillus halodurans]|uniref:Dihydrolipoamide acetyltransferase component of pyruvate dehydrogenase complex n=1 Tax=Lentibacillus halodurans TaxID=237679 RepID=A0A1I0XI77_9BACI|nr:dihydrolipoamide acetyltransferase family protein [Lentibacillus halodurans]SFB00377.1 pyruvate dehydrogenase E2 component (dihydrolipoamide acetyltransferase) [Lentibacillus halodurans]
MAKEVFMPKLSSTMEVGTLLQWFKAEGDPVEVGEPLFEIMTDKINIEVESYEEGVLLKRYYDVDEEIPVNAVIGYVGEENEEVPEEPPAADGEADDGAISQAEGGRKYTPSDVPTAVAPGTDGTPAAAVSGAEKAPADADGKVRATPAARRVAREQNVELGSVKGSGPKGRVHEQDVKDALDSTKATPLAGKIAGDQDVDLSQVEGSGPHGKVRKADVMQHTAASAQVQLSEDTERIKLKGLRKAVADKMVQSTSTIPHVTLTSEVDMTHVIDVRKSLLPIIEKQTGYRLSYTEILMKATSQVLEAHPRVNASLIDHEIVLNKSVNIGLAVDVEDGLIVPSVKEVNHKGLAELTEVSKTVGKKARDNQLTPAEMTGSTFSISNLGMYAVDGFTPIINPPETAILGVGRIVEKPVVVDGEVEVRPMMVLSLSFDHRAIDGAPAAAFLTDLKERLENPYGLLI